MAVQRDKVIASAEKLVAKGKIEVAIKEYERLLDDNPNDVNTLNRIGDLWVRINRNDEAVKVFGKIADHYSKDGFFLKAIAIFKKINKLDPSKLDIYAKLADLYAKQGLAMEAKSQYQVLADYYIKHGDPGNALSIYRKISDLDPNSINVHVKLADLYSQNNQTAEALKEYDRVGRMLLKRGMLDEAVQVFRKALKIDTHNTDLVESLVNALIEAKDFDDSIQILESSLEANPHPRLFALLGRAHLAKGDNRAAQAALERGMAMAPGEPSIREALSEVYVRQGSVGRAFDTLSPLIDAAAARGESKPAVEMINRILRSDTGNIAALEKLVVVYTRANEETNILASMNSLAEAHIARGDYQAAAGILDKLIAREPQNAQHRNKLNFVRQQTGGVDTIPARSQADEAIYVPAPAGHKEDTFQDVEGELSLDLDSSPPLDLDMPLPVAEPAAVAPPPPIVSDHASTAVDDSETDDDLDFITEHLTEAEVFAKYGLSEKAAEHLRAVIDRAPKNTAAYDKLYKMLLDEGDLVGARSIANTLVGLLNEEGDTSSTDAVSNEFLSRGHVLNPPRKPPTVERRLPSIEVELPDFSEDEEIETDVSMDDEVESIASPEPADEPDVEFDLSPEVEVPQPATAKIPTQSGTAKIPTQSGTAKIPTQSGAVKIPTHPGASPARQPEPPTPVEATLPAQGGQLEPFYATEAGGSPAVEDIGEIDFYIEQELFDEAREKIDLLLSRFPNNADILARADRLEAGLSTASGTLAQAGPLDIGDDILSGLADLDDDGIMTMPPPPPPAAAAEIEQELPPLQTAQEENLFADEDDFFDLAAELEEELDEESDDIVSLSEEEQSLEEIFREFKKGVEQQLDSEDYDTHYNLGIAYKEMGLIDEAIGEFQLASKDTQRAVECASMLGLCFLEKGMPQLAIKWYRKGLEMPEIKEDEHVGLLYDLGSAFMEVGDAPNAQKAFLEVYGMNSSYRDVAGRIKQLQDVK
jgi:pilus assembly protein FimV